MTKRQYIEEQELQPDDKMARIEEQEFQPNDAPTEVPNANSYVGLEDALQKDGIPMESFIEYFAPCFQQDREEPEPPLKQLIDLGAINTIGFLINKGMGVSNNFTRDGEDADNSFPLGSALAAKQEEIALLFIEEGAPIEEYDTNLQPISVAARNGLIKATKALYKKGAHLRFDDLNADNHSVFSDLKDTPMYQAIKKGHTEVVKFLLSVGGEFSITYDNNEENDSTDAAFARGNLELYEILTFCKLVDDLYKKPNHDITAQHFNVYNDFLNNIDESTKKVFADRIATLVKSEKFDDIGALQEKLRIFENNLRSVQENANLDLLFLKNGKLETLSHEGGVMTLFSIAAFKLQPYIKTAEEIQTKEYGSPFITREQIREKANEDVTDKIQSLFDFIDISTPDELVDEVNTLGNELDTGS